jgi:hypothetical protein
MKPCVQVCRGQSFGSGGVHQFGQYCVQQSCLQQQAAGMCAFGVCQHASQFLRDAFDADLIDLVAGISHSQFSGWFQSKAEGGGESNGAEQAQFVFAEAGHGVPDCTDHLLLQISLSADVVEYLVFEGIEKHTVDGEVASLGIFCG